MSASSEQTADTCVTVHIENVPVHSIMDALVAIEAADGKWFDAEQHERATNLVLGLRTARDSHPASATVGEPGPWPAEAFAAFVEACRLPAFREIVEEALVEAEEVTP